MSRAAVATFAGLTGFALYVTAVTVLGQRVNATPWPMQFLYYAVVGTLWVLPARWLMLWAARLR